MGPARCLAVDQAVDAKPIETMYPGPQRLTVHVADPRRIRPAHPVADRR
jgi:hypothetical protein